MLLIISLSIATASQEIERAEENSKPAHAAGEDVLIKCGQNEPAGQMLIKCILCLQTTPCSLLPAKPNEDTSSSGIISKSEATFRTLTQEWFVIGSLNNPKKSQICK
jgi:hypothetical protein